jgi:CxxC motif-containing protein
MEKKELICVNCPKGCRITVSFEQGKIVDIKGYSCDKGRNYAAQETVRPMRILTTTVKIENCELLVLPVITSKEIPLDMMETAMKEVRKIIVDAPIHMGDVIVKKFLGTDADLIASRSLQRK